MLRQSSQYPTSVQQQAQQQPDSIILEEEFDPNYEPTEDEIAEYAQFLEMNLPEDTDLLWIAREGLKAPLPNAWKPCKTDTDEVYYFNFESGESVWEHPCDEYYKSLYQSEREKKQKQIANGTYKQTQQQQANKSMNKNANTINNTSLPSSLQQQQQLQQGVGGIQKKLAPVTLGGSLNKFKPLGSMNATGAAAASSSTSSSSLFNNNNITPKAGIDEIDLSDSLDDDDRIEREHKMNGNLMNNKSTLNQKDPLHNITNLQQQQQGSKFSSLTNNNNTMNKFMVQNNINAKNNPPASSMSLSKQSSASKIHTAVQDHVNEKASDENDHSDISLELSAPHTPTSPFRHLTTTNAKKVEIHANEGNKMMMKSPSMSNGLTSSAVAASASSTIGNKPKINIISSTSYHSKTPSLSNSELNQIANDLQYEKQATGVDSLKSKHEVDKQNVITQLETDLLAFKRAQETLYESKHQEIMKKQLDEIQRIETQHTNKLKEQEEENSKKLKEINRLQSEYDQQKRDVEGQLRQIEKQRNENDNRIKELNEKHNESMEKLQNELEERTKSIAKQRNELERSWQSEETRLKSQSVEKDLDELNKKLEQRENEVNQKMKELEAKSSELDQQIDEYSDELNEKKQQHIRHIRGLDEKHRKEYDALQQQHNDDMEAERNKYHAGNESKQRIEEMEKLINELRNSKNDADQGISRLEEQLNERENELNHIKAERDDNNDQIVALDKQLKLFETQIEDKEKDIEDQVVENKKLQEQINALKGELQAAQVQAQTHTSINTNKQADDKNRDAEIRSLRDELAETKRQYDELKQELKSTNSALQSTQSKHSNALKDALDSATQRLTSEHKKQMATLKHELDEAHELLDMNDVAKEVKLNEYDGKIEELEKQIHELKSGMLQRDTELQQLRKIVNQKNVEEERIKKEKDNDNVQGTQTDMIKNVRKGTKSGTTGNASVEVSGAKDDDVKDGTDLRKASVTSTSSYSYSLPVQGTRSVNADDIDDVADRLEDINREEESKDAKAAIDSQSAAAKRSQPGTHRDGSVAVRNTAWEREADGDTSIHDRNHVAHADSDVDADGDMNDKSDHEDVQMSKQLVRHRQSSDADLESSKDLSEVQYLSSTNQHTKKIYRRSRSSTRHSTASTSSTHQQQQERTRSKSRHAHRSASIHPTLRHTHKHSMKERDIINEREGWYRKIETEYDVLRQVKNYVSTQKDAIREMMQDLESEQQEWKVSKRRYNDKYRDVSTQDSESKRQQFIKLKKAKKTLDDRAKSLNEDIRQLRAIQQWVEKKDNKLREFQDELNYSDNFNSSDNEHQHYHTGHHNRHHHHHHANNYSNYTRSKRDSLEHMWHAYVAEDNANPYSVPTFSQSMHTMQQPYPQQYHAHDRHSSMPQYPPPSSSTLHHNIYNTTQLHPSHTHHSAAHGHFLSHQQPLSAALYTQPNTQRPSTASTLSSHLQLSNTQMPSAVNEALATATQPHAPLSSTAAQRSDVQSRVSLLQNMLKRWSTDQPTAAASSTLKPSTESHSKWLQREGTKRANIVFGGV